MNVKVVRFTTHTESNEGGCMELMGGMGRLTRGLTTRLRDSGIQREANGRDPAEQGAMPQSDVENRTRESYR